MGETMTCNPRPATCDLQIRPAGCLPFSQKIRKFRFEVKWKGNFRENLFGNCGQPPEVVLFFRSEWNSRNALTICENLHVSRPFLTRSSKICGMECCVVNGKHHVLIRLVMKFGKSLTFCNDHSIRIIWLNGKHPGNFSRNRGKNYIESFFRAK